MSFTWFLAIYVIGLIIIPIGFGMWKYDDVRNFDTDDYIIACLILAAWPFVLLFVTIVGGTIAILFVISYIFRWLFKIGVKYREHLIEKAYRKRHPEEFVDTCEECDGKRD